GLLRFDFNAAGGLQRPRAIGDARAGAVVNREADDVGRAALFGLPGLVVGDHQPVAQPLALARAAAAAPGEEHRGVDLAVRVDEFDRRGLVAAIHAVVHVNFEFEAARRVEVNARIEDRCDLDREDAREPAGFAARDEHRAAAFDLAAVGYMKCRNAETHGGYLQRCKRTHCAPGARAPHPPSCGGRAESALRTRARRYHGPQPIRIAEP